MTTPAFVLWYRLTRRHTWRVAGTGETWSAAFAHITNCGLKNGEWIVRAVTNPPEGKCERVETEGANHDRSLCDARTG